jgi:hypothetical protein
MNLNVVAVAIAPVGLIAQQHLRLLAAKYRRKASRRLIEIRPRKPDPARRIRVERGSISTVGVAQTFNPVNTENASAAM